MNILILGATGSIGVQTLEIIRENVDKFTVFGLTANKNYSLLAEQINEFKPKIAVLADESNRRAFESLVQSPQTKLLYGSEILNDIVSDSDIDLVLNSLVGFSGFNPTVNALKAGKKVALANKESLVVGGELLKKYIGSELKQLIPVDSEHSAILQCLEGEGDNEIEKMIITASGGPFRSLPLEEMKNITVEKALKHPNWSMGSKITIDSATMMNKGLEIIEAHWLFDISLEKIEPVIHPQSIIHSMVTFKDGSTKAQLGYPDMKVPIQYALTWPERMYLNTPRMDFSRLTELTFEKVDYKRFPCLKLALDAIDAGGFAPAVLNAANEIAVYRFLDREIPYIGIHQVVEKSLENITSNEALTISSLQAIDEETRCYAMSLSV